MGRRVSTNGYIIDSKNLLVTEKDFINYAKTATIKMNAILADADEELWVDKIFLDSPDCTDTNNILVDVYLLTSTEGVEGATENFAFMYLDEGLRLQGVSNEERAFMFDYR